MVLGMSQTIVAKPKTLAEEIAGHAFLAGMNQKHVHLLAESAMFTEFTKGEVIFREGDLANRFYLIRAGKVLLESRFDGEGAVLVQEIGAGDVLGWSWLFPPYYWHFDARAAEATKAIFFYGTRLRAQCEDHPEFGYELTRRMAITAIKRLHVAREQLARFCHCPRVNVHR
jgi:CRP-like cAMP-binding protein